MIFEELLRDGIFNLGFIALSNYSTVYDFLNFWHQRVIKYGHGNSQRGMFYDQLWVNYVPAFYNNYLILKHPGYNMANWNLHERVLYEQVLDEHGDKTLMVNKEFELRFFHFSGYKYNQTDIISSYSNRFDFIQRPDLKPLFDYYSSLLIDNRVEDISKLKVFYFPNLGDPIKVPPVYLRFINRVKKSIRILIYGKV